MTYNNNRECIENLYDGKGLDYSKDHNYLELAFNEVNKLWLSNLKSIKTIKYIMIAEAPLWGKDETYIYNLDSEKNTNFFFRSDLEMVLGIEGTIKNKADFIEKLNEIGLIIIEILPFALNANTQVNYRQNEYENEELKSIKLAKQDYRKLVNCTLTTYFEEKLEFILQNKRVENIEVFCRYQRVQKASKIFINSLKSTGLLKNEENLKNIYKQGGGIDRNKLKEIINPDL